MNGVGEINPRPLDLGSNALTTRPRAPKEQRQWNVCVTCFNEVCVCLNKNMGGKTINECQATRTYGPKQGKKENTPWWYAANAMPYGKYGNKVIVVMEANPPGGYAKFVVIQVGFDIKR